jgi:hypothetical protein
MGAYEFGAPELIYALGDVTCDLAVDFDDINVFVLALTSAGEPEPFSSYYAAYPLCNHLHADCNEDGEVDFKDINPFVLLLAR